jgi:hypothetical protein
MRNLVPGNKTAHRIYLAHQIWKIILSLNMGYIVGKIQNSLDFYKNKTAKEFCYEAQSPGQCH